MKRKVAALLMAGVMMGGMAISAQAANESSKDMTVTCDVQGFYQLSIPANINMEETGGTKINIGVDVVNIQPGKELNIKLATNKIHLKRTGDPQGEEKLATSRVIVRDVDISGATPENPITIGTYKGTIMQPVQNQLLTLTPLEDADGNELIDAGTYRGILTFTAAIEDEAAVN